MEERKLGKYIILKELGAGGFATVLHARDETLGRDVALKILDPLLMREKGWTENFYKEARAVAKLQHAGIVTIYEIDETNGRLFIAMQLVEGSDLDQYIRRRGRLPWNEACRILTEVAQPLHYAHTQLIVHRDIKPSNILMNKLQNSVMLSDFGLAQAFSKSSYSIALTGGIVGTPQYIAPEIWDGEQAAPQTDIYALGCVMYELLTGKTLFQGGSVASIIRKHLAPLVLPEQWPADVPPAVNEWFRKALAQSPADRYPTVLDAVQALPTTGATTGAAASPPVAAETPPISKHNNRQQPPKPINIPTNTPVIGWRSLGLDDDDL